jgi:hypothetical protein
MEQVAAGIILWTAPHPEWRPTVEEVNSWALVDGDVLALVDPLLPDASDARRAALLAYMDRLTGAARRLELLVTIPYHTRSAESLYERYSRTLPTRIWGHLGVKKRLTRLAPLEVMQLGPSGTAVEIADGAALAYAIGKPRRSESPLYFPNLRAVAFGDAVVGAEGGLRFWNQSSTAGADWYRDAFAPTLLPLLEHDIEHVLVTHGPPVLRDGRRALEECLAAAPVTLY